MQLKIIKDTENKNKFKEMTIKEKSGYIWEYYKFPIIISIIVIYLIFSAIHSILTRVDVYCNLTYYAESADSESLYALADDLSSKIIADTSKEEINMDPIFTDSDYTSLSAIQEFGAKVSAKEVDLAIVSKDYFEEQCSQDMFLDLSTVNGFNELNLSEDYLVKGLDEDGNEKIFGLNTGKLNEINSITGSDKILVILINSERIDAAENVIEWLCTH